MNRVAAAALQTGRWRLFLVALIGAAPLMLAAQTPSSAKAPEARQAPRRDSAPVAPAATGTGVISGVVVSDDGGATPIRRVRVSLESGLLEMPRGAVTDDRGRFVFTNLPAGNYTLTAMKSAYVTVAYGARRAGERPGLAIAVRDGQRLENIVMPLPRGAVITGVIRQPNGQPAPGMSVQVMPVRIVGGQRTTSMIGLQSATTDDRGVYRVFGLAPGEYVVEARANQGAGAFFFGRPTVSRRVTADELRWAERAVAAGAGTTPAPAAGPGTPPEPGQSVMPAPVYYPGTTVASSATVVPVRAGEERAAVDFVLEYVPSARVSGTTVGPDGRPIARVQYTLTSAADDGTNPLLQQLMSMQSVRSLPDGQFVVDGVAPGRYVLSARAAPGGGTDNNELAALRMLLGGAAGGGRGASSPFTLWAREEFDVNGRDVTNLSLRLAPGMTVSGRIAVEASSLPPLSRSTVSVTLSPVTNTSNMPPELAAMQMFGGAVGGGSMATAGDDGVFEVKGVAPGRYRVNVMAPGMIPMSVPGFMMPPPAWMPRSIVLGGRDISDLIVEIRPNEDVKDVAITLTDRVTELSGVVYDEAGRPTPAFPIVAFATDRVYWAPGSRRVQQARPASDGRFKFTALPAGEYYVCAPTDLDPNDLADPFFLEQLIAASFKLTIAPGEKKTQDLRLK